VKQFLSVSILALSVAFLSGCGGGGASVGGGTGGGGTGGGGVIDPTKNPSIVDPLTDGDSMGKSLQKGKLFSVSPLMSTRLKYDAKSNTSRATYGGYTTVQQNLAGGYDVYLFGERTSPGQMFSFGYADVKPGGDSWEKAFKDPAGKTLYTVALWNAGKGGKDGVGNDQNGQTFHKILGYYAFDNTTQDRNRGHVVVGNQTDPLSVDLKTKKATYDGYFYANVSPAGGPPIDQSMAVNGGMRLVADFDANEISGQSTSFGLRNAGSSTFTPQSETVWFKPTTINSGVTYGSEPGTMFRGDMTSTFAYMNGRYVGTFYGGNAQEAAGTIVGTNGGGITEGFFTTVIMPTPTP
jgi:hypothetical protein